MGGDLGYARDGGWRSELMIPAIGGGRLRLMGRGDADTSVDAHKGHPPI